MGSQFLGAQHGREDLARLGSTQLSSDTAERSHRLRAIGFMREHLHDKRRAEESIASLSTERNVNAVLRIQTAYRGHRTRKWTGLALSRSFRWGADAPADSARKTALEVVDVARRALTDHNSAVKVQKIWRGWRVRRRIQIVVAELANTNATKLQSVFRRQHGLELADLNMGAPTKTESRSAPLDEALNSSCE